MWLVAAVLALVWIPEVLCLGSVSNPCDICKQTVIARPTHTVTLTEQNMFELDEVASIIYPAIRIPYGELRNRYNGSGWVSDVQFVMRKPSTLFIKDQRIVLNKFPALHEDKEMVSPGYFTWYIPPVKEGYYYFAIIITYTTSPTRVECLSRRSGTPAPKSLEIEKRAYYSNMLFVKGLSLDVTTWGEQGDEISLDRVPGSRDYSFHISLCPYHNISMIPSTIYNYYFLLKGMEKDGNTTGKILAFKALVPSTSSWEITVSADDLEEALTERFHTIAIVAIETEHPCLFRIENTTDIRYHLTYFKQNMLLKLSGTTIPIYYDEGTPADCPRCSALDISSAGTLNTTLRLNGFDPNTIWTIDRKNRFGIPLQPRKENISRITVDLIHSRVLNNTDPDFTGFISKDLVFDKPGYNPPANGSLFMVVNMTGAPRHILWKAGYYVYVTVRYPTLGIAYYRSPNFRLFGSLSGFLVNITVPNCVDDCAVKDSRQDSIIIRPFSIHERLEGSSHIIQRPTDFNVEIYPEYFLSTTKFIGGRYYEQPKETGPSPVPKQDKESLQ